MGWRLNTAVPVLPQTLNPEWPPLEDLRKQDEASRIKSKAYYDKRHGVRPLEPLKAGQKVHVKKMGNARVVRSSGKRSYIFRREEDRVQFCKIVELLWYCPLKLKLNRFLKRNPTPKLETRLGRLNCVVAIVQRKDKSQPGIVIVVKRY